ncbi:MAG: cytochrome c biogenesis protein CcsA [Candidatus Poseidoniaceae archaeon]|nr:cytochrome c biogenesis protein CcsA [Candidatus Poseidoniaceae archaeon]
MYWAIMPAYVLFAGLMVYRPTRKASWLMGFPFLVLSMLFLADDESIALVAKYGAEDLPNRYRFAATWAAREGPILLWVMWMGLLATIWGKPFNGESGQAAKLRLRLMNGFSLVLLLIAWGLDPFALSNGGRGVGLNELLQTDLMVIHPPLVFLAYSLCITLACTALASIMTDTVGLKDRLTQIARPAFFVTTLGVGLGGLWAYVVLDWGGYWAWDPVETGSLLPWISLVMLLHLRTRPGKATDTMWVGTALASGALALFATMITRAGGVWAVSVHTFVVSSNGSTPNDVIGRIFVLAGDQSGVEVITYLMGILVLISAFIAWRSGTIIDSKSLLIFPIIGLTGVIYGGSILGEIPLVEILLILIALSPVFPLLMKYDSIDKRVVYPLIMIALFILHRDLLLCIISLLFAVGMVLEDENLKGWGWSAAGVVIFLASSWSGMLDMWVAGLGMVTFVGPWLLSNEESSIAFDISKRSFQQKLALWTPVVAVGLYLCLTLVILISSIDSIQFNAHELFGAPLIAIVMIALTMWGLRAHPERVKWVLLSPIIIIPIAWFFGDSLGYDSHKEIGSSIARGSIALVILIPALMAVPAVISLIHESREKKGIPMWAHVIHLGLVLLVIGHVLSTTIVDRGTYAHSVTMVKGETTHWEGYDFVFTEIIAETEGLEVGDGYLGVIIEVYCDGEYIGSLEPGILRFDSTGTSRSEVDRMSMLSGDLVMIMDGTQAGNLMEGSDLVRIMVYDIPGIHLVWGGWILMLGGSLATWGRLPRPTD